MTRVIGAMETTDESNVGVDEAVINAKRMQPCSQLKNVVYDPETG